MSFAIGFMVSVYHALKFELIGESPLSNFLKSTQVVNVKGEQSVKELADSLQSNEYFWFKELKVNEDSITARINVFITISIVFGLVSGVEVMLDWCC